jgi:signal transduction histidine kinase
VSVGDLGGLPGVVFFVRSAGEVVEIAPGVEELWGYTPAELLAGSPPPLESVLLADRVRVAKAWAQPGRGRLEFRLCHRDGTLRWVDERVDADGQGLWLDRTPGQHERRRGDAEALMRRLGGLAGGIVHEVNNPLAGIVNYARVAQRLAGDDERLGEVASGILSEAQRVLGTIDVLRSLCPRPAGEEARPVDAGGLVRGVLGLVRAALRDSGIRYTLSEVPPDLPRVREQGHGLHIAVLLLIELMARCGPTKLDLGIKRLGDRVQVTLSHDTDLAQLDTWLARDLLNEHAAELTQRAHEVVILLPTWDRPH